MQRPAPPRVSLLTRISDIGWVFSSQLSAAPSASQTLRVVPGSVPQLRSGS